MSKKIVLLGGLLVFCGCVMFLSCKTESDDAGSPHVHSFATEWANNETHH